MVPSIPFFLLYLFRFFLFHTYQAQNLHNLTLRVGRPFGKQNYFCQTNHDKLRWPVFFSLFCCHRHNNLLTKSHHLDNQFFALTWVSVPNCLGKLKRLKLSDKKGLGCRKTNNKYFADASSAEKRTNNSFLVTAFSKD